MQSFSKIIISPAILIGVVLSGCGGYGRNTNENPVAKSTNAVAQNYDMPNTNVEELGLIVTVPFVAEDIVWKVDAARKKVIAVFRYPPEDANKIVAEAGKFGEPASVSIAVESWFPDELIAQSEMGGDSELKGTAYPANAFFQDPYTTGRITRIEGGDYFVLELFAK
jgi:hypothetical protein